MAIILTGSTGVATPAVVDASGGNTATINSMTPTADSLQGFRNRIINGDMRIDQRNAGAAVTTSGAFPVDRFFAANSTDGAFSAQQDSSAPTGFVNSLKFTTTTADGTLTTTQNANVGQRIEGTNIADLAWGTANAKTVTLSFWVRSSLTGTFGGALRNSASDRSYPYTYTISVANTWEQKSVTIAGDTTGTWLTTNGIGIQVFFGLGAGPDRSGTAGAWAAAAYASATGAVSVIGTLNATWYITGVQLEVGSVATPFERRDYGRELIMCQRYYYTLGGENTFQSFAMGTAYSTTNANGFVIPFPVTMRGVPTFSSSALSTFYAQAANSSALVPTALTQTASEASSKTGNLALTVSSGIVAGNACLLLAANSTSAKLNWSAEL